MEESSRLSIRDDDLAGNLLLQEIKRGGSKSRTSSWTKADINTPTIDPVMARDTTSRVEKCLCSD